MVSSVKSESVVCSSDTRQFHFSDSDEGDLEYDDSRALGIEDSFSAKDYSSRMEEIMDSDEEGERARFTLDSSVDVAATASNYSDRLREVLGQDESTDNERCDEDEHISKVVVDEEDYLPEGRLLDTNSETSTSRQSPLPRTTSRPIAPSSNIAKPFLHPSVSRLRSRSVFARTPESSSVSSSTNFGSPSPSQLLTNSSLHTSSDISNDTSQSSTTHLSTASQLHSHTQNHREFLNAVLQSTENEAFRWTSLHLIGKDLFASTAVKKAMTVLGARGFKTPTVLAANGNVCIGTSDGKILVYDFRQSLRCICGDESSESRHGAVTALTLSYDRTCVAAGYSTGYIQIYNLANPTIPIRSVPPTSLSLVYSGRKEGHIHGSRIVSIGFVAGRHTAIVSADVHGLAFYHTLGKVLFVEASDILRILGRYPDPLPPPSSSSLPRAELHPTRVHSTHTTRHRNPRYTILSMSPLPLGTSPHVTDIYSLVAMLTPTKLVVVGLKPSPKTWFKVPRGLEEGVPWQSQTKWRGSLAWFPSVYQDSNLTGGLDINKLTKTSGDGNVKRKGRGENQGIPAPPMLAFAWGKFLKIIEVEEVKVQQVLKNAKTGKVSELEVGAIDYKDVLSWTAKEEILGLQWLNFEQLIVLTTNQMGVYDLQTSKMIERIEFDSSTLMSPTIGNTANGKVDDQDSGMEVAHSMRIYKGKLFLLARDDVRVGTLVTWADRILSLVKDGDFLSAIELARAYYLDEAPGNRNGLPKEPKLRKEVIGEKLQELMVASARYAFSEDRMTDSTHITPDGRGVDRTSLFENLVTSCCRACIALNDTDFLFEELFQKYDDCGISGIYLRHLEPFLLDNEIRYVPPWIMQRLISLHEEDGRSDLVERVIWHIDPECLDINQAIQLCQRHHLYDALIYTYTRALKDYVAPIVELLGLIRRVLRFRRAKAENAEGDEDEEASLETMILNSYKVYPYLSHVLYGLTYPSGEPLPEEEALHAKKDIYTFLFYGRSSVWPPGGGTLILTSDEEGGTEPTYPYIRQLLQWDAESFLHSLDIAFEDAYLHDETQTINRLIIVRILLELIPSLPSEDATFVHIFIARNAPKYPKFLSEVLAPSVLHKTLVHLTLEGKSENKEDRQLAVEYLLSAYNPHDTENVIALFQRAGFYRILRTWHRRDQRWEFLFMTYLDDQDIDPAIAFEKLDEVLVSGTETNRRVLPYVLASTAEKSLARLLELGVHETALLLQKHLPHLHERALGILGAAGEDVKRLTYLQALIPHGDSAIAQSAPFSFSATPGLWHMYIDLQSRFEPSKIVAVLESLPHDCLDWDDMIQVCEDNRVCDAVIWAYDARNEPQKALDKAVEYQRDLSLQVVQALKELSVESRGKIDQVLNSLQAIGQRCVKICLGRSRESSDVDVPLEDIWFTLLNSQINVLQLVSACQTSSGLDEGVQRECLSDLRSSVQTTFSALVSITSTSVVSFPRLFKRLTNSTTSTLHSHYDEFRTILTGMLDSYRSDQDMLTMAQRLMKHDLFDTMVNLTRQKARGWTLERGICTKCRNPLSKQPVSKGSEEIPILQVIVARTGKAYHFQCHMD